MELSERKYKLLSVSSKLAPHYRVN